jgi:hypothetical protein
MDNPYLAQPDYAYWSRAVSRLDPELVDPVTVAPFRICKGDKVATAGSCFAQHIARALVDQGHDFLVTEHASDEDCEGFGIFPARFGNIYSVRQLRQLFDRAYGLFEPVDQAWVRADGRYIDPVRPRIRADGFASAEALAEDRVRHLAAVREMFETCDVFIFTLGLTEAWVAVEDGAVAPFHPGVVGADVVGAQYRFVNFPVDQMAADLSAFEEGLRMVNPSVRIILTVSPVPLVATYEDRHVTVSTCYSKAALRVVAEMVSAGNDKVAYFPSFEIVTSPHARGRYYAEDARNVTPEGVAHVMKLFAAHFLSDDKAAPGAVEPGGAVMTADEDAATTAHYERLADIICDEDLLDS